MTAPNDGSGVPRKRDTLPEPLRAYAVMRTVRALERLAFRPMSAPELAASVQIDPRTTRRLLARLVAEDYVAQTGDRRHRYQLTLRLAALGRQAIAHTPWLRTAAPWVATLAAHTSHTAHLWIPSYGDVACVLHAHPDGAVPEPMLGELLPAHASAPGKVLLAHRQAWRESILARPLERGAELARTDPRDLHAELDRVRARGYATDHAEHRRETDTLAGPIFLADEAVAALGLSLTNHTARPLNDDALSRRVVASAAELTKHLQGQDR